MSKYQEAYEKIEKSIKSDKELFRDIKIIALLGSASDKEESEGWSDLDILIVLAANPSGEININKLNKMKTIAEKISSQYVFPISLLPHTENDFKNYVCFEYLRHYSFGKVTYAQDSSLKNVIENILRQRNVSEKERRSYCLYHLRHIRFNYLRKYISLNNFNTKNAEKELSKLLIDKVIKVTDLALNYSGLWPKNKREIIILAEEKLNISNRQLLVLKKAFSIRKNWIKTSQKELSAFMPAGTKYLLSITSKYVDKESNRSTPEEKMTP